MSARFIYVCIYQFKQFDGIKDNINIHNIFGNSYRVYTQSLQDSNVINQVRWFVTSVCLSLEQTAVTNTIKLSSKMLSKLNNKKGGPILEQ